MKKYFLLILIISAFGSQEVLADIQPGDRVTFDSKMATRMGCPVDDVKFEDGKINLVARRIRAVKGKIEGEDYDGKAMELGADNGAVLSPNVPYLKDPNDLKTLGAKQIWRYSSIYLPLSWIITEKSMNRILDACGTSELEKFDSSKEALTVEGSNITTCRLSFGDKNSTDYLTLWLGHVPFNVVKLKLQMAVCSKANHRLQTILKGKLLNFGEN